MEKITASNPDAQSRDVVSENIESLKALFPEAFLEGMFDFEVLKQLLGGSVDEREEKYGLNWHGKRRARQLALTPSMGTLRPCPEESVDWETTQNLMIEGDNLEVLKLLQKSYAGKVKLIYIDPPYNTGGDFVYPDNYHDNIRNYLTLTGQRDSDGQRLNANTESSGRFHTDWLCMVYPRLQLARNLLSDDGLLFISIDDHEVDNLRLLCRDIFGDENFICQICVVSNPRGRQSEAVATTHEYVLVYARDASVCSINGQSLSEQQLADYKHTSLDGRKYRTRGLRHRGNASLRSDRPKMFFPIYVNPATRKVALQQSDDYPIAVLPRKSDGRDGRWEWGPDTVADRLDRLEAVMIEGRNEWDVYQREFLEDEAGGTRSTKWKTVWSEKEINYQNGKTELKDLFGESPLEYPKPVYLLRKIIEGTTDSGDIILDFFAGSGTTGQAVLEANCSDSAGRAFILVQLPEPTGRKDYPTITAITEERLRRAGNKLRKSNPLFQGDCGFRVFKLDSSNIQAWDPDRDDLSRTLLDSTEHLKSDRSEQDVLFELLLKLGLNLTVPIEQKSLVGKSVHSIGAGSLFVCLDPKISRENVEPLAMGIVEWHRQLAPAGDCQIVFRDSAFADDVAKTNLTAILQQHGLENVRSL